MARIITYSLHAGNHTSDCYYQTTSDLADQWTPTAIHSVKDILDGFRHFSTDLGHAERPDAEYAFELLVMGVMLREHGGEAAGWPAWSTRLLKRLNALPSKLVKLEAPSRKLQGWIGGWIRRKGVSRRAGRDLDRLIEWMRANNLNSRAERLAEWRAWLEPVESVSSQAVVERALTLAEEFNRLCQRMLGKFTSEVESFRALAAQKYKQRYDAELVLRTPLEYHLGMYGTELLNRAHRDSFVQTKRRMVLLPPCMRARSEELCRAVPTLLGSECQACTPGCHVNQVTRLGQKKGFEVYLMSGALHHISDEAMVDNRGIGLVGVSCALTNWSGGWDTEALNLPSQGVLLDYVGCKYHWDDTGIQTAASLKQIEMVATAGLSSTTDTTGNPEDVITPEEEPLLAL